MLKKRLNWMEKEGLEFDVFPKDVEAESCFFCARTSTRNQSM